MSVPWRIGNRGYRSKSRDVDHGEILIPQSDESAPHLAHCMVVVVPRLKAVGPANPVPQNRGIVGVAMPRENTIHGQIIQLLYKAIGGTNTTDRLSLTTRIAVLCGRCNADDILFPLVRGLVALLYGSKMELDGRDMKTDKRGDDHAAHGMHTLGGGIEPIVLILSKTRASPSRLGG